VASRQFDGIGDTGNPYPRPPAVEAPLSYSSATNTSAGQATAWRNTNLSKGYPIPLSAQTRGTTFNWNTTGPSTAIKTAKDE